MRLGCFERLRRFVQFAADAGAGGTLGDEAGQGLRLTPPTTYTGMCLGSTERRARTCAAP